MQPILQLPVEQAVVTVVVAVASAVAVEAVVVSPVENAANYTRV